MWDDGDEIYGAYVRSRNAFPIGDLVLSVLYVGMITFIPIVAYAALLLYCIKE